MKKHIAIALLSLSIACHSQNPVQDSQKQAIREFPELMDSNSDINKRFILLVSAAKASDEALMKRNDWPLILARRAAADVGMQPSKQAEPVEAKPAYVNPLDATGRTTISGKVLQRTAEGLLVDTRRKGENGLVWLSGVDGKEGSKIVVSAIKDGTKSYTDLDGAARTVDAYKSAK